MSDWRLIDETTPRSGRGNGVLLWCPRRGVTIGWWNDDRYARRGPRPFWRTLSSFGRVTYDRDDQPTHWMPLPEAPEDSSND